MYNENYKDKKRKQQRRRRWEQCAHDCPREVCQLIGRCPSECYESGTVDYIQHFDPSC